MGQLVSQHGFDEPAKISLKLPVAAVVPMVVYVMRTVPSALA
jgi:hypothetical protein